MNFQILIIMKVYCPSHKRPDAPLFSISKNLIIVIDHEEEIEEYKKINEPRGHKVVYINNNQRVMGARNWILEQDEDWSLMIDDDINEFCIWNKETQTYDKTDYDYFIEETEKVVNEVDQRKTGMIGYRHISGDFQYNLPIPYSKDYEKISNYVLWQCIVLNNKLLKSLNFKYEGYLADNNYFSEDTFLMFWCDDKKLTRIMINNVTFKCIFNNENDSTVWKGKNSKEIKKLSFIWLLDRFKHNLDLLLKIQYIIDYHSDIKVFVPSHNRPDSKLFEITQGLNIVLQHEEDVEPYSKWKDRHNVIYIPELRGLLDARNWILEQSNDWVLMLDDDISQFYEKLNIIKWDDFLQKAKHTLLSMDSSRVGVVGLNRGSIDQREYSYEKSYSITNYFKIFQVVFLNCKLLNFAGYKYEGYPYDGVNGQRAYGEDWDILFYCRRKNIQMAIMNNLFFDLDYYYCNNSVCWENDTDKYVLQLLAQFWLLDKYKDNQEIVNYIFKENIKKSLEKCNNKYGGSFGTYDKIMNKVSYGTLNKFEGDKEMKKNVLIGGLVLCLLMGGTSLGLSCCSSSNDDDKEEEKEKFVDDKYIGLYKSEYHTEYLKIEKNQFIIRYGTDEAGTISNAYTIDNALEYISFAVVEGGVDTIHHEGVFLDENTFRRQSPEILFFKQQ